MGLFCSLTVLHRTAYFQFIDHGLGGVTPRTPIDVRFGSAGTQAAGTRLVSLSCISVLRSILGLQFQGLKLIVQIGATKCAYEMVVSEFSIHLSHR